MRSQLLLLHPILKVCFGFGALLAYSFGRAVGKTRREPILGVSNAASLPHTVFPTARPKEYSTVVANRGCEVGTKKLPHAKFPKLKREWYSA